MTITELNQITMTDWLISFWPLWLLLFGVAMGVIARWLKP